MCKYYRRIVYIYEYNNNVKGKNVGYCRIEGRDNKGMLAATIKQDILPKGNKCVTVMWYRQKKDRLEAVKDIEINTCDDRIYISYEFDLNRYGKVGLYDLSGIVFRVNSIICAGIFDETDFMPERMDMVEEFREEEACLTVQEIPDFLRVKKKNIAEVTADTKKIPIRPKIKDWKDMLKKYEEVNPFEDEVIYDCIEIDFGDLKYLPYTLVGLINNSFLLHGLYEYKHLLLGKYRCKRRQGLYVLGIPGRYINAERKMAMMYGFENFKAARHHGIKVSNFGYWYIRWEE